MDDRMNPNDPPRTTAPPHVNVDNRYSRPGRNGGQTGLAIAVAVIAGLVLVMILATWNRSPGPVMTEQTTEVQPTTPPAPAPAEPETTTPPATSQQPAEPATPPAETQSGTGSSTAPTSEPSTTSQ